MNCPDCGGPMWDNRQTKRNARQPDFKCKDKEGCGKGVWEDAGRGRGQNGSAGQNGATRPHVSQRPIGPLYNECLTFAKAACEHHFGKDVAASDIVAATATLFIQAVTDGAPIRAPKVAPAPPPPPRPEPAPEYTDADLPF